MPPFGHMMARQYTLKDGLSGMLVEDICQDRRGLLWIATADGGVSRFDGEAFENFQLSDGLPHLTVMTGVLTGDGIGRFTDGRCVDCTTEIGGRPIGRVHDMVTDSTGTTPPAICGSLPATEERKPWSGATIRGANIST